jgi:hypothetical protein
MIDGVAATVSIVSPSHADALVILSRTYTSQPGPCEWKWRPNLVAMIIPNG